MPYEIIQEVAQSGAFYRTHPTNYLTDTAVRALTTYLSMRGMGPTDHVFLYRHQPLSKDLIHGRLKIAGLRLGFPVSAHRLRHTAATQLLNAGCPVTSIQKFLGHKKLNTTMIYARAYDQTVEADYFAAMRRVEQRLQVSPVPEETEPSIPEGEKAQLLALAEQMADPQATPALRLDLFGQLRSLLIPTPEPLLVEPAGGWITPPAVFLERDRPPP